MLNVNKFFIFDQQFFFFYKFNRLTINFVEFTIDLCKIHKFNS